MFLKHNLSQKKAETFLQSEEYLGSADRSFNFQFPKKPIATRQRGRSITRIEFQDYMCGQENPKYAYCRVFVMLRGGTLLEYRRNRRITDNSKGLEVFKTVIKDLKSPYWHSFTDIT